VGDAGKGVAPECAQTVRSDVADNRREVGFDVQFQLLEHAVECGEQRGGRRGVSARRSASRPKKGQAGDQRGSGADDGIGGIDRGLGKSSRHRDAEIELREREVEAHACTDMLDSASAAPGDCCSTWLRLRSMRPAVIKPSGSTLKPLCSATTPAVSCDS